MEFAERTELDQGFAPVIHDQVKLRLSEIEAERIANLGNARKYFLIAAAAWLGFGLFIAAVFRVRSPVPTDVGLSVASADR